MMTSQLLRLASTEKSDARTVALAVGEVGPVRRSPSDARAVAKSEDAQS